MSDIDCIVLKPSLEFMKYLDYSGVYYQTYKDQFSLHISFKVIDFPSCCGLNIIHGLNYSIMHMSNYNVAARAGDTPFTRFETEKDMKAGLLSALQKKLKEAGGFSIADRLDGKLISFVRYLLEGEASKVSSLSEPIKFINPNHASHLGLWVWKWNQ